MSDRAPDSQYSVDVPKWLLDGRVIDVEDETQMIPQTLDADDDLPPSENDSEQEAAHDDEYDMPESDEEDEDDGDLEMLLKLALGKPAQEAPRQEEAEEAEEPSTSTGALERLAKTLGTQQKSQVEPELTKTEQQLRRYARTSDDNDWDCRGGMAQKFNRENKDCPEWKACKRAQAVAEFKMKWAKKAWDKVAQKKIYKKSWQRIDTTLGEYLPMIKILEREGNDEEGRKATRLIVTKAFAMGGQWISWNDVTERYDILHLTKKCPYST